MLIHHHLGLGDHLICNGLVRFLASTQPISLICKKHNEKNVHLMYQDIKIDIVSVNNDEEALIIGSKQDNYLRLGVALNANFSFGMEKFWDRIFYEQANIDFNYSWTYFKYTKSNIQNKIPNVPYAFLCHKGSDGIDGIDYSSINKNLLLIYSNQGNFFDNIDLIQNASEIHCINSAYIHLIDRMDIPHKTKLIYHKSFKLKPYSNFTLRKNWHII